MTYRRDARASAFDGAVSQGEPGLCTAALPLRLLLTSQAVRDVKQQKRRGEVENPIRRGAAKEGAGGQLQQLLVKAHPPPSLQKGTSESQSSFTTLKE